MVSDEPCFALKVANVSCFCQWKATPSHQVGDHAEVKCAEKPEPVLSLSRKDIEDSSIMQVPNADAISMLSTDVTTDVGSQRAMESDCDFHSVREQRDVREPRDVRLVGRDAELVLVSGGYFGPPPHSSFQAEGRSSTALPRWATA